MMTADRNNGIPIGILADLARLDPDDRAAHGQEAPVFIDHWIEKAGNAGEETPLAAILLDRSAAALQYPFNDLNAGLLGAILYRNDAAAPAQLAPLVGLRISPHRP